MCIHLTMSSLRIYTMACDLVAYASERYLIVFGNTAAADVKPTAMPSPVSPHEIPNPTSLKAKVNLKTEPTADRAHSSYAEPEA
jgi:hypothetical protein